VTSAIAFDPSARKLYRGVEAVEKAPGELPQADVDEGRILAVQRLT